MPLRSPNGYTDTVLLTAWKNILLGYPSVNTNAGINNYPVYILAEGDMLSADSFPALLLSVGVRRPQRNSRSTFVGTIDLICDYYDRWEEQTTTFDAIRAAIADDLALMAANIESNESLAQSNTIYAVGMNTYTISGYEGTIKEQGGSQLISRRLTVPYSLLPYDV